MPTKRQVPRPRDRIIGARLRAIRKQRTTLSLEAAAKLLGWGLSTMSRIENGQCRITMEHVAIILTAYRIPATERDDLLAEARAEDVSGWWDRPLPGVPTEMGTLASYAADATSLTNWAVSVVPGLLQIEEYAMAVMFSEDVPPDVAELRWFARRSRQKILGTLDYAAFICETALRTPFGGREGLRKQLQHLLDARERGIAVRVVPAHLPFGLVTHSWLYMTFPNTTPVVNVEVAEGGVYLHDDQAAPYVKVLAKLDRLALPTSGSQNRLREILKEV
ncbi:helix-turn-helix domain-containing protein [Actinophytocola sediminis]